MRSLRFAVVPAVLMLTLSACGSDEETSGGSDDNGSSQGASSSDGSGEGSGGGSSVDFGDAALSALGDDCAFTADGSEPAAPVSVPDASFELPEGTFEATVSTNRGELGITLDREAAPCTVGSFAWLASEGYYDDTPCHRLTTSGIFVLQCGDPSGTGTGGPGYSYADELDGSETYPAGTVAMANAGPDTNGSQFFLVYEDTQLPPSYTVFGQLDDEGLAAVQDIAEDGATDGLPDGPPAEDVVIEGVALSAS